MNSDKMKEFLTGVGLMTELWMITYNGFRKQGLPEREALEHTKAFMAMTVELMGSMGDGGKEDKQ